MIRCNNDYKNLVKNICKIGNEVNGTYELVGEKVEVMLMDSKNVKEEMNIDDEFEHEFIDAICNFKDKTIGSYITSHYFNLVPAVVNAAMKIYEDNSNTRRAVISFPKEHCFQSIQFLVRENTINIVCFMRSCNAIKNLPYDIWICYKLADMFKHYIETMFDIHVYNKYKLTMMIGSLHVFKEDENVL